MSLLTPVPFHWYTDITNKEENSILNTMKLCMFEFQVDGIAVAHL